MGHVIALLLISHKSSFVVISPCASAVDIAISAIIVMYKLIDSSTVDFATIFEYMAAACRVLAWVGTLYSSVLRLLLLSVINGCLFCRRFGLLL